jgi:hypothetical protein
METSARRNMETNIHCLQRVLRNTRTWYHREYYRYPLHQVIFDALRHARPADWHQLVLEHPHISTTDRTKIAYTRDNNAGNADRQVTTTIGKYLARHFPTLKDNIIRDLSALYTATGIKIVHTIAEMLYHLNRGPKSCMQGSHFSLSQHPYNVYDPQYGWAMCVREEDGDTVGRALVMMRDDKKYFVRSYLKPKDGSGYSHSDNTMEAWLQSNGFEKFCSWEGEKIRAIPHDRGGYVAPYLDGDYKRADLHGDYFKICDGGEYCMDDTSGRVEDVDDMIQCENCGDRFCDGDGYWAGAWEDQHICNHCVENEYTYAYSRRGNEYYIRQDEVIYIDGNYYDENYLDDNEIVELDNGDYARLEDAVEIDNAWYHIDDDRICLCQDTDEYALQEDCWQCDGSDNWYSSNTDYIQCPNTLAMYHPDHAPEHLLTSNEGESE